MAESASPRPLEELGEIAVTVEVSLVELHSLLIVPHRQGILLQLLVAFRQKDRSLRIQRRNLPGDLYCRLEVVHLIEDLRETISYLVRFRVKP